MERLQKSMTAYVKTLSKRNEGEDKEKSLPVSYLGSTMLHHGEDFENDSEFGQCLISRLGYYIFKNANLTHIQQVWVEPTSGSDVSKNLTLPMQPRAGSSHSNAH